MKMVRLSGLTLISCEPEDGSRKLSRSGVTWCPTVWQREICHNERYLSGIECPVDLVESLLDLGHVSNGGKEDSHV